MAVPHALRRMVDGHALTADEARGAIASIMQGEATAAQIAALLTAWRMKGETAIELAGAARALRDHAVRLPFVPAGAVDTCGTGGDGLHTLNISTCAALVVAACGVPVAKHGNRSVSSRAGSADLLEALGVPLDATPDALAACLRDERFAFLFAPVFHAAMKHAAQPRREIGIRTIFNLIGPLSNPAQAPFQLVGVFHAALLRPLAEALGALGAERAWVVHGSGGLDEIATDGPTHIAEWREGRVREFVFEPREAGIEPVPLAVLRGGDVEANAARARALLRGEADDAASVVALNAGAALCIAGAAESVREGVIMAHASLATGEPWRVVERVRAYLGGTARA